MGEKRDSIRTLPTGEQVIHSPDGTQRLIPTNILADRLAAVQTEYEWANAERQHALLSEVTSKQEAMDGGLQPVPADKRPC